MATTEEVIGQTKDGRILVYFENAGPASYATGGFSVSITTLRTVERVIRVGNNSGYRTESEESTITGNSVKIPVHYYGYACPGTPICATGWEIPAARDLSKATFSGVVIGF